MACFLLNNKVLKQKWGVKMEDNKKIDGIDETVAKARRKFLKSAAAVAVTAPAVVMLLSASATPAKAETAYCEPFQDGGDFGFDETCRTS